MTRDFKSALRSMGLRELRSRIRGALRAFAYALVWPFRRFFDPRFQFLVRLITDLPERISPGTQGPSIDATTIMGSSLSDLLAEVEEIRNSLNKLLGGPERAGSQATKVGRTHLDRVSAGSAAELDEKLSAVLNREVGHQGFAAERGLWFNPPILLAYAPGEVWVDWVNERIAEIPYVCRALAGIAPGSAVLDVGAAESMVSFSLASLGYQVTAVDPRPYPLSHPRLRSVAAPIHEWTYQGTFAAVICLSTIEHIGIGAYGQPPEEGADLAAMRRIRELTSPRGLLVLTTRFGRPGLGPLERTYDRAGLEALLEGWAIEDLSVLVREDRTIWTVTEDEPTASSFDGDAVALVTARRSN